MKKLLSILFVFFLLMGSMSCVFADDDDYDDDDYRGRHFYSSRYDYDDDDDFIEWREHGNYDRYRARQYRNWYNRCYKYGGYECSYSRWNRNKTWTRDDWDNYWKQHRPKDYERVQKMHRKANAFHSFVNATRNLLYW